MTYELPERFPMPVKQYLALHGAFSLVAYYIYWLHFNQWMNESDLSEYGVELTATLAQWLPDAYEHMPAWAKGILPKSPNIPPSA